MRQRLANCVPPGLLPEPAAVRTHVTSKDMQTGRYTVQLILDLDEGCCEQLQRLLFARPGLDLADLVSELVAAQPFDRWPPAVAAGGRRVPVRLYLSAAQRDALAAHGEDPAGLVAALVCRSLAELPSLPPLPIPAAEPPIDRQRRRTELAQLRERRARDGADAPAWIDRYLAQLEDASRETT